MNFNLSNLRHLRTSVAFLLFFSVPIRVRPWQNLFQLVADPSPDGFRLTAGLFLVPMSCMGIHTAGNNLCLEVKPAVRNVSVSVLDPTGDDHKVTIAGTQRNR